MSKKLTYGSDNVTSLYVGTQKVKKIYAGSELVYESTPPAPPAPTTPTDSILFYSLTQFTIESYAQTKTWDGTLYYSNDYSNWSTWDGTSGMASAQNDGWHKIYLRGVSNTIITGAAQKQFVITGSNIMCVGNMDKMLDYTQTPTMGASCFRALFLNNANVDFDITLPQTTLTERCYASMFKECSSMTKAPTLPATTLANYCYSYMFANCSSLVLPAQMSATTLATCCCEYMYSHCTSMTNAPSLPALTLVASCYQYMFEYCSNLIQLPALPATTGASYAYRYIFQYCSKIKMSKTQSATYPNIYRIPPTGTVTYVNGMTAGMFKSTGGSFTSGEGLINDTLQYTSNQIVS